MVNYYESMAGVMPDADPAVFGLPCRFPCRAFDSIGQSHAMV
jgi:hypothetical protein